MIERQVIQQSTQASFDGSVAMIRVIVPCGHLSLPADTYARLDEWARYWRDRLNIVPHGRCRSIEGRYVAEYPDSDQATSIPIDVFAAIEIEKIVARPTFPRKNHLLLKKHFVELCRPRSISNACHFHYSDYGDELKRSVLMVRNNLTRKNNLTGILNAHRMHAQ